MVKFVKVSHSIFTHPVTQKVPRYLLPNFVFDFVTFLHFVKYVYKVLSRMEENKRDDRRGHKLTERQELLSSSGPTIKMSKVVVFVVLKRKCLYFVDKTKLTKTDLSFST